MFEWFLNKVAGNGSRSSPLMDAKSFILWVWGFVEDASLMLTNHREAVKVPSHSRSHFCAGSLLRKKMRVWTLSQIEMTLSTADWLKSVGHQWLRWGQPCLVGIYSDSTFMHGRGTFSNPSLIFVIPYRATDTTLDVASFPHGDDAHGLLRWCRLEYPLPCLEPCREGFLFCIIM